VNCAVRWYGNVLVKEAIGNGIHVVHPVLFHQSTEFVHRYRIAHHSAVEREIFIKSHMFVPAVSDIFQFVVFVDCSVFSFHKEPTQVNVVTV
jgi:hypothetical protein